MTFDITVCRVRAPVRCIVTMFVVITQVGVKVRVVAA